MSIAACLVSMVHPCWRTGKHLSRTCQLENWRICPCFKSFPCFLCSPIWECMILQFVEPWAPHFKETMRNVWKDKTKLMIYFQSINNNTPTAQTILPHSFLVTLFSSPLQPQNQFSPFHSNSKLAKKHMTSFWVAALPLNHLWLLKLHLAIWTSSPFSLPPSQSPSSGKSCGIISLHLISTIWALVRENLIYSSLIFCWFKNYFKIHPFLSLYFLKKKWGLFYDWYWGEVPCLVLLLFVTFAFFQ